MTVSAYASIAYSRVGTRMSQALEAFFPEDGKVRQNKKSDSKGSIAQDLVSLSPANQMRKTISHFKETTAYTEMNLILILRFRFTRSEEANQRSWLRHGQNVKAYQ